MYFLCTSSCYLFLSCLLAGKRCGFFFIFTFSETGGLIFAYWEFSFQFSNHKHGMAATIKKYTLENSKGFSVKTTNLNLFSLYSRYNSI